MKMRCSQYKCEERGKRTKEEGTHSNIHDVVHDELRLRSLLELGRHEVESRKETTGEDWK